MKITGNVCGYVNTKEICAYCKMSKKSAQRYSKTCIKSNYEIFLNDEHIRLEKEKEYQKKNIEEKKTKNKKVTKMIGITASIVITILIVSIGCYYVITEKIILKYTFKELSIMRMKNGNWRWGSFQNGVELLVQVNNLNGCVDD